MFGSFFFFFLSALLLNALEKYCTLLLDSLFILVVDFLTTNLDGIILFSSGSTNHLNNSPVKILLGSISRFKKIKPFIN